MGGVDTKLCVGVPRSHVIGEIEEDLVVFRRQDILQYWDPTL